MALAMQQGSEADMADIEYTGNMRPQDAQPDEGGSSFGFILNVIGAITSLALVIGVGVWGYWLLVRDVSGVPVVRALEGPLRVQPADPGGEPADYQGLAVNAVAAQGTASPPADRVVLAPKPVELADEDAPMGEIAPVSGTEVAEAAPGADDQTGVIDRTVAALVAELTDGVEPISGDEELTIDDAADAAARLEPPELMDGDVADDAPRPDPAVLNAPGLRQSLRPKRRPARAVPSLAATADGEAVIIKASAQVPSLDVDADTLPPGTRLAQLGAYDTPEIAQVEWDRLNARFGDYLDGKKRVIQQASSGGRTFYRLRAMGFDDLADARRFCSALVAENADCIPVTSR